MRWPHVSELWPPVCLMQLLDPLGGPPTPQPCPHHTGHLSLGGKAQGQEGAEGPEGVLPAVRGSLLFPRHRARGWRQRDKRNNGLNRF